MKINFIRNIICKLINFFYKMSAPKKTGGLAGIVAGESSISTVGLGSGLNYRGYNVGMN